MRKIFMVLLFVFMFTQYGYSAHPLITDDTGTQGRGRFQLELNGEYAYDSEDGVKDKVFEFSPVLTYGALDNLDVIFSFPYQLIRIEDKVNSIKDKERGFSDVSFELKWRFYENDGLSLALKPGISFPTGDEDKGLGTGKVGYSVYLLTTKEIKPVNVHLSLGYIRNENKFQEEKNIYHLSVAGEYETTDNLKLVADVGIETNTDPSSNNDPAFGLIGFIYYFSENFSFDAGYKFGLNREETDSTYLLGFTFKF